MPFLGQNLNSPHMVILVLKYLNLWSLLILIIHWTFIFNGPTIIYVI